MSSPIDKSDYLTRLEAIFNSRIITYTVALSPNANFIYTLYKKNNLTFIAPML